MKVKLAPDPSFGNISRQMGKHDAYNKGFFGFAPVDTWTPNVNLYEGEGCYLVCVDLAGVDKQQIDVIVQNQRLRLTGRREVPQKEASESCPTRVRVHLMEIDHGNFSREVELPADVNQENIIASFNNGLLWIELPKK